MIGIWVLSSFAALAEDESENIAPVEFRKIKLYLNIGEEKFETLMYVTGLEELDAHRERFLVIIPEQPDFAKIAAGFGESSDAGTFKFVIELLGEKVKAEIKIDWKDDQNAKPGYVAEVTGSVTDEKGTRHITGTAVIQEGFLTLK